MKKKSKEQIFSLLPLLLEDKPNEILQYLDQNPTCKSLKFKKKTLNDKGALTLIKVVNNDNNFNLTALILVGQQMSAKVANSLFSTLCINHTITALDLSGNNKIGTEGAALAEMLETNTTLISFRLGSTGLTSGTVQKIAEVQYYSDRLMK